MEAIMVPYSPDQSISPYNNNKHMKNPNRIRNSRHFVSRSIENFAPRSAINNGLLFAPPPHLSHSFPPPSISLVNPNQPQHQQQQHYKKPPLLPLPITKPYASLPPSRTRGLSCSPPNNKSFNRSIKKSKPSSSSSTSPKKEDSKKDSNSRIANTKDAVSECLIIATTNRLGPDPNDLPKDVSRVLFSSSSSSAAAAVDGVITCKVLVDLEKFSGSVFTLSPPPSSLPLPKFSLRPKLGCNAEADGFDAGATDNLRRLLRLR